MWQKQCIVDTFVWLLVDLVLAGLRKGSAINKRRLAESDDKLVMLAAIQAFREALAEAATDPASLMSTQTLKRHSRGIVISGGGELQFVNAYATMRVCFGQIRIAYCIIAT